MSDRPSDDGFPALGDLLRHHRLAVGLTQEALAERAGLSVHGIQKLERGVTRPYRDTIERLLAALPLSVDDRYLLYPNGAYIDLWAYFTPDSTLYIGLAPTKWSTGDPIIGFEFNAAPTPPPDVKVVLVAPGVWTHMGPLNASRLTSAAGVTVPVDGQQVVISIDGTGADHRSGVTVDDVALWTAPHALTANC